MAEKPTFASVIKNRGFRFLWINQILVQLAYNTLNFALIVWVFKLTDSNFAVSALMLAIYLPAILFGIFAGVFVDLSDRRKIILLIDILLAASFLLFIPIKGSYPLILLNTFFINSLAQFFMPSESSSIPMLVSKKQLFLANSLFSLTLYGSFMVGFTIGGPILNSWGINAVFLGGGLALLLAFILAINLPAIKATRTQLPFKKYFSAETFKNILKLTAEEARETSVFIKSKMQVTASIVLLSCVQGAIGVLAVTMPSYVERVLKIHATDASYFVMLPLGLGMVIGAYLVGRLFHGSPKRSLVSPAILIGGLTFFLIGIMPSLSQLIQSADLPANITRPRYFIHVPSLSFFFALLAFLSGLCTVSIIIPCQTVLQENTTGQNRGKIFAVLAVIMTSASAVAVILAGGLADIFGVSPTVAGLGVITIIIGIAALRPNYFLKDHYLPKILKEFLGAGHWEK